MSQFPDYDARRIRNYTALGVGLLIFIALTALHRIFDWAGFPLEGLWKQTILGVSVAAAAHMPAQIAAKWLVQRYPTTSATYDQ